MKFELTEVWGLWHAFRGMRNPYKSHDKSDSLLKYTPTENPYLGEKDITLAQKLIKAGGCHRKFMRQIMVSVDITAPLYWWKEFDTYKVGTVANSESTMHKLADTPITAECFEMGGLIPRRYIEELENIRLGYCKSEGKSMYLWKQLIVMLPESWLQKRTVTMNYENILQMVQWRSGHKLTEWSKSFMDWAHSLPYADELLFLKDKTDGNGTEKEAGEKAAGC